MVRFDKLSAHERSVLMSKIRSIETKPEMKLRHELFKRGIRFRKYFGKEKIDIAFPRLKLAVFVDGCFWHSCPVHSNVPKSNTEYWKKKLELNMIRESEKEKRLVAEQWTVIHIWEHSIEKSPVRCAEIVLEAYSKIKNQQMRIGQKNK